MDRVFKWIKNNSLWLISFGLCLSSSGLDGAYMSRWMTSQLWFLGYILNTMSDVGGMILIYWYGVFQQSNDATKKKLSNFLLKADIISIMYSWLFSWRQLRFVMPLIEVSPISGKQWEVELLSFVGAGFIPLTLTFLGYAQSIKEREEKQVFYCWCGQQIVSYEEHIKIHIDEARQHKDAQSALDALKEKYTFDGGDFEFPTLTDVVEWRS